jgi:putative hemolysin
VWERFVCTPPSSRAGTDEFCCPSGDISPALNLLELMNNIPLNIALIMMFILIGGVYAAAEIALVSLRDSQVRQLAQRGTRGRTVLRLHQNPNRFLSAVQVGVTLAGFLSAAFGGAILANALRPVLQQLVPISDDMAEAIALVVITALIAYVSIVVGELTAKRLALQRSETSPLPSLHWWISRPAWRGLSYGC